MDEAGVVKAFGLTLHLRGDGLVEVARGMNGQITGLIERHPIRSARQLEPAACRGLGGRDTPQSHLVTRYHALRRRGDLPIHFDVPAPDHSLHAAATQTLNLGGEILIETLTRLAAVHLKPYGDGSRLASHRCRWVSHFLLSTPGAY